MRCWPGVFARSLLSATSLFRDACKRLHQQYRSVAISFLCSHLGWSKAFSLLVSVSFASRVREGWCCCCTTRGLSGIQFVSKGVSRVSTGMYYTFLGL